MAVTCTDYSVITEACHITSSLCQVPQTSVLAFTVTLLAQSRLSRNPETSHGNRSIRVRET